MQKQDETHLPHGEPPGKVSSIILKITPRVLEEKWDFLKFPSLPRIQAGASEKSAPLK
jgi:hypothetical protein